MSDYLCVQSETISNFQGVLHKPYPVQCLASLSLSHTNFDLVAVTHKAHDSHYRVPDGNYHSRSALMTSASSPSSDVDDISPDDSGGGQQRAYMEEVHRVSVPKPQASIEPEGYSWQMVGGRGRLLVDHTTARWPLTITGIGKKAGLFAKLQPGRARKRINAT